MNDLVYRLRQAIAEAEKQEPVGYVSEPGSCTEVGTNSGVLHTEWVGLTHDEVNSWELPNSPTVFEFAQFIEAKLKEKNCG